ncbi:hypothetical protein GOBAR_AA33060 [Gossypium barbadense]|uniref:Uncharacterized protein n=1 Tax=Gossypium barbadense TaxID=3634 RepID=A0A2P5W9C5_GOSBA|nr:hypothetical protein GOBAR_AA33060 [Gossypium barbadense]
MKKTSPPAAAAAAALEFHELFLLKYPTALLNLETQFCPLTMSEKKTGDTTSEDVKPSFLLLRHRGTTGFETGFFSRILRLAAATKGRFGA